MSHETDAVGTPGPETSAAGTAAFEAPTAEEAPASELPATLGVKRVLVVGTGAISVCHLPAFVTLLRHHFEADTAVCLTRSAREMVSPRALEVVSGRPVIAPDWSGDSGPSHVSWADWAEAVIVWPATLNFMSRCALGLADSLPSAIVLSTCAPVIFAPSVAEAAVRGGPFRRAVRLLTQDGHGLVGPVVGHSVSNWEMTPGACAPADKVLRALADLVTRSAPPATDPPHPAHSLPHPKGTR
ncbi:pantothenate metabolism flavoprotein [Streptomyces sp. WAC 01529]|uniref:flavoprotein n=1 Tax=Streptomyces sp. WAC 01529 TaxID=2203205 RepID=UPI000F6F67EB|nr:flavoprotein [Streptomyces sp. WAC 01529]AZM57353.1 pantothenate metabolism flavoprotein [Streptomyces sp. WAC 01529]